jgi:hypothetical protein
MLFISFSKVTSFVLGILRETVKGCFFCNFFFSPDGRENPFLIKREASFIKKDWNDSWK